jgi:NAD-dependent dihydropyrimidine dehydrogenase PreA subunit
MGWVQKGYVKIQQGPRKHVFEHRVIMEQHLGRELTSQEVIHHRDGNKQNNAIENLEIISSGALHRKMHAKLFQSATKKQCGTCLETKNRTEFYLDNRFGKHVTKHWDTHKTTCKECHKRYYREYRQKKKAFKNNQKTIGVGSNL